jgi:hypothetical protein
VYPDGWREMGIYDEVMRYEIRFEDVFLPPWPGLWSAWRFREALELLVFDWGRQEVALVCLPRPVGFGVTVEAPPPKQTSLVLRASPWLLRLPGC